jgi:hypothetical protein
MQMRSLRLDATNGLAAEKLRGKSKETEDKSQWSVVSLSVVSSQWFPRSGIW